MATPRHLKNAPIREAILDIRVELPANSDSAKLLSVHPKIEKQYPKKQTQWKGQFEIQLSKSGTPIHPTNIEKAINGYLYQSDNDKQLVQFRLDGFTFNRMAPYENWEKLRDEARTLWDLYVDTILPKSITRVALRYINHLAIPLPIREFDEYLTAPPSVPKTLPQGVNSFLTRIVINETQMRAAAIVTQALEKIIKPDIIPIILDIDVIKEAPFKTRDPEIWETFEKLRTFKNQIFFESVTEKTLELFQ